MKIPTYLKHKPVIVSENYDEIDGRNENNTDAKGLSLGLAQWNDRGKVDISAKVWRYTGEKWSRQSEEMPLHRVLDLAVFTLSALKYLREDYRQDSQYKENPQIERIPLQGGAMDIRVCTDNEHIDEDMSLFKAALAKDDELIGERLARLAQLLRQMGYCK